MTRCLVLNYGHGSSRITLSKLFQCERMPLIIFTQYLFSSPSKGWKEVSSLLSGQFCASLNFIDKAASVEPRISFRPEGTINEAMPRNNSVFYAALPHEAVCTENLTPWKKLLPCFSKAGLASLLNAGHLFNTNYFSLALDLRPICMVCIYCAPETHSLSNRAQLSIRVIN